MDNMAQQFLHLTESVIETYNSALVQVSEGKDYATDRDLRKIYESVVTYLPNMAPTFESICDVCPAFAASAKLKDAGLSGKGLSR